MYTNIEFLDTEPIENVITAMHFQVDKTIFFGYEETIKKYQKQSAYFLEKCCGIKEVVFHTVSKNDLNDVVKVMRTELDKEVEKGNRIFFDLTGGESLILVAFGMLSKEYGAPMHMYDVEADKLIEMDSEDDRRISMSVKSKKTEVNLDKYMLMRGAKINHSLDKDLINPDNEEFMQYIRKVWTLVVKYKDNWNFYAGILQRYFKPDHMYASNTLSETVVNNFEEFKNYMADLAEAGVFVAYKTEDMPKVDNKESVKFSFYYKSLALKDCIWKSGTILELHVYDEMKNKSFHCYESVHIDWDGIIYGENWKDVTNEIDVLCITGNVPMIISCKGGKLENEEMREAMYELATVSNRFGGKYARKVLATLQPVLGAHKERAKEMGIELWCYGE